MKRRHPFSSAATPCTCCLSRRALLGAVSVGLGAAAVPAFAAPAQQTPQQALDALLAGNRRFMARKLQYCDEDLAILRQATVERQVPFAAVLSCSDSRVPVELLFDQSIGHVFVARVAGNVASAEVIASLEYGAAVLGTRTIMVLGHSGCGAVQASMEGKAVPGQISALYRSLRPAVDQGGGDLTKAIQANAKIQAALLRDSSPVLGDMIKLKALSVVPAYYDLASGRVTLLSPA